MTGQITYVGLPELIAALVPSVPDLCLPVLPSLHPSPIPPPPQKQATPGTNVTNARECWHAPFTGDIQGVGVRNPLGCKERLAEDTSLPHAGCCARRDSPHDVELTDNIGDSSVCVEDGNTIGTAFAIFCILLQKHIPESSRMCLHVCGSCTCPKKAGRIGFSMIHPHLMASSKLVLTSAWQTKALSLLSALAPTAVKVPLHDLTQV